MCKKEEETRLKCCIKTLDYLKFEGDVTINNSDNQTFIQEFKEFYSKNKSCEVKINNSIDWFQVLECNDNCVVHMSTGGLHHPYGNRYEEISAYRIIEPAVEENKMEFIEDTKFIKEMKQMFQDFPETFEVQIRSIWCKKLSITFPNQVLISPGIDGRNLFKLEDIEAYTAQGFKIIKKEDNKMESIKNKIERLLKQGSCEVLIKSRCSKEELNGIHSSIYEEYAGKWVVLTETRDYSVRIKDVHNSLAWSYGLIEDVRLISSSRKEFSEQIRNDYSRDGCSVLDALVDSIWQKIVSVYEDGRLTLKIEGEEIQDHKYTIMDCESSEIKQFRIRDENGKFSPWSKRHNPSIYHYWPDKAKKWWKPKGSLFRSPQFKGFDEYVKEAKERIKKSEIGKLEELTEEEISEYRYQTSSQSNNLKLGSKIQVCNMSFRDKEKKALINRILTVEKINENRKAPICTGRHWWMLSEFKVLEPEEVIPVPVFKAGDKISLVMNKWKSYVVHSSKFSKHFGEWVYLVKGEQDPARESNIDYWKDPRPQIIGDDYNVVDWPKFCKENPLEAAEDTKLPKHCQNKLFKKFKKEKNKEGLGLLESNEGLPMNFKKVCYTERVRYKEYSPFGEWFNKRKYK